MLAEKIIQNEILRAFGTRPGLRIWRANTGVAKIGRRVVRFGIPGQADITGILPNGLRVEIEVKSADGRQSPEQRAYETMIRKFGGVYVLARSVQDVREALSKHGV